MGLLRTVKTLLGHVPPEELARELKQRGATRELWRFAEDYGTDVLGAWMACPRGSWCLEIAARCGVDRRLVAQAAEDVVAHVKPGGSPPGDPREWAPEIASSRVSSEALEEARAAARAFVAGGAVDAFSLQMEALGFAIVEASKTVREARADIEDARDWGRFEEMLAATDVFDEAYADAHAALATIVRRRIPAELVRAALKGHRAHPYR